MTYDDAGGSYYGALAAVDGATITLANDAWPASDWEMGGWLGAQVYVINGTGATQFRRVVQPGVNTTASPTNRTWVLVAPFDVTPDVGPGGSFVQIMPFRGRNIFARDMNVDTGELRGAGDGRVGRRRGWAAGGAAHPPPWRTRHPFRRPADRQLDLAPATPPNPPPHSQGRTRSTATAWRRSSRK